MEDKKHLILIDGSGYIFRAYHALPPMSRPDGTPVNAVYGFTSMVLKLVDDLEADWLGVIFDTARKTFRTDIYSAYKANRPPPPDDLVPQFALIREAVSAFGLPQAEMEGFEADDLIATYSKKAAADGHRVTVVSSDKDLMQLIDDNISMMDPMKNTRISYAEVEKRFGVHPDRVVDVQSLAGDSTDNVPGVPGIGIKTAAQLITEYGDLDNLLAHAEQIKQPKRRQNLIEFADQARVSRKLVRLAQDAPVKAEYNSFKLRDPDPETLTSFLETQGFKSILSKFRAELDAPDFAAERPKLEGNEINDPPIRYALVQNTELLQKWADAAVLQGVVAVDTETDSLDSLNANLVGVSLALSEPVEGASACYIPLAHVSGPPQHSLNLGGEEVKDESRLPSQVDVELALEVLRPVLEGAGILKILHNAKYDSEVFARYGIKIYSLDDTMLLSYVLEGGAHSHGMDELARVLLDRQTIKYSDVTGTGRNKITFAEVPLDQALEYAAEDAEITLSLHRILKPRLVAEKFSKVYERIERPLIAVLQDMESEGILVDANHLQTLSDEFEKRILQLSEKIHEMAGHEFNIGSPKQLGEVLFNEMGLAGGKKGKTGAYATGAEILEGLAGEGHEVAEKVLDWRQLSKLKSTYTDALVREINPVTGRVHTSYSQAIASTGRLSSNDPNLQNIPVRTEDGRKIREAFIAKNGFVLLSADYSQIELRLLAHVANIEALKEAFEKGSDIHAATASDVFGIPVNELDPATRSRAKAINFGIIYGISAYGLAKQLSISQGHAKSYIDAYFEKYPGVRDYMVRTKEFARKNGFVSTIFGRRVYMPGINDKNPARRNFHERAAINAPLQGAAADIIKKAMIRMPGALKNSNLSAKMLLQVHDELIFEVPENELDATVTLVKTTMESAATLSVPLICDTGWGKSWADAH
ncbi:MAG: DNA polymerase I [Pseudomonadota bacterium]|nr:DNA polymerase I [Pseudomonadota bacterium]